jgi:NAD(P)-dependent dehydrogenase (short-subunit alcohol dehydrogenase family)
MLSSLGAVVLANSADVADEAQVADLFNAAETKFGGIDLLVNNAGIVEDKSLFDLSCDGWDAILRTHLRGSFLCTQAMARSLRKARSGGAIINMTSTSGMLGNTGQVNESTAKAGVYGLTRTSSIELQKFSIRVNAIAAIAKTRLTEHLPMFEKVDDSLSARHIAPAAVFLASDLSSDLSGTVLSVAGGRISVFELSESQGRLKEGDGGLWTAEQIAENYDSIARR